MTVEPALSDPTPETLDGKTTVLLGSRLGENEDSTPLEGVFVKLDDMPIVDGAVEKGAKESDWFRSL